MNERIDKQGISNTEKQIFRVGTIAAFIAALGIRRNMSAEISEFFLQIEAPNTVLEWFNLFQENRFLGLIFMDFLDVINNALVAIIYLSLYYLLKDTNKPVMQIANLMSIIGVTIYFVSNQAFSMLVLSDRYANAIGAEKALIQSAGEAVLAIHPSGLHFQGLGGYLSLLFIGFAGLLISIVMLQNHSFGKRTAYCGMLANGIMLGYFLTWFLLPTLYWIPIPLSSIPLNLWYILTGIKLYSNSKNS